MTTPGEGEPSSAPAQVSASSAMESTSVTTTTVSNAALMSVLSASWVVLLPQIGMVIQQQVSEAMQQAPIANTATPGLGNVMTV